MDFFTSPVFIVILSVLVLGLGGWVGYLHTLTQKIKQQRDALMLKGDMNLEQLLNEHTKGLSDHQEDLEMIYKILDKIHGMATRSIQKVSVIRFNPFAGEGEGGNQSFAMALLDEKDNGIIISSLHTREETRMYAKPIKNGVSEHFLSKEEKDAISKAQLITKE